MNVSREKGTGHAWFFPTDAVVVLWLLPLPREMCRNRKQELNIFIGTEHCSDTWTHEQGYPPNGASDDMAKYCYNYTWYDHILNRNEQEYNRNEFHHSLKFSWLESTFSTKNNESHILSSLSIPLTLKTSPWYCILLKICVFIVYPFMSTSWNRISVY